MKKLVFLILCANASISHASIDSCGFAIVGQRFKGKHGNFNTLAHFKDKSSVPYSFNGGSDFGSRRFYTPAQGVIVRWGFKGIDLYEGTYTSSEFEAGMLLGRNDRNYYYKSWHANDCLFYDRYIFDENRDELYFSAGQTVTLPMGHNWKLSSGGRISVQQSIYASGSYKHYLTYKPAGTYGYTYQPDITDPDDIFGRPKKTEIYEGKLKASTALVFEIPAVFAWKPSDHISFLFEARWGWGISRVHGSSWLSKKIFAFGFGLGYDFY